MDVGGADTATRDAVQARPQVDGQIVLAEAWNKIDRVEDGLMLAAAAAHPHALQHDQTAFTR